MIINYRKNVCAYKYVFLIISYELNGVGSWVCEGTNGLGVIITRNSSNSSQRAEKGRGTGQQKLFCPILNDNFEICGPKMSQNG